MSNQRRPGPEGIRTRSQNLADGTNALQPSPLPGSLGKEAPALSSTFDDFDAIKHGGRLVIATWPNVLEIRRATPDPERPAQAAARATPDPARRQKLTFSTTAEALTFLYSHMLSADVMRQLQQLAAPQNSLHGVLGSLASAVAGGRLELWRTLVERTRAPTPAPAAAPAPRLASAPTRISPPTPEKHWIGVKVVDEDGKLARDVTVQCKCDDGSSLSVDMSTAGLAKDGSHVTPKVLGAAQADFSFPDLYNREWWPQGAPEGPSGVVMGAPPAAEGDCLLSIADSLKFRSYHSIWDQPQNDTLKKQRPNPNMLVKGDVLSMPFKKGKVVRRAVDQTWVFVVRSRRPFKLRLVVIDRTGHPLAGKKWEFKASKHVKGATGKDGLIEITDLGPTERSASLEVTLRDPVAAPTKSPAPKAATDPPPYPPNVVAEQFKDKMPPLQLGARIANWTLQIGSLPPAQIKNGTLTRLCNLGFNCAVGLDDAKASAVVKAYQRFYLKNKSGSGLAADIQDDVAKRHDH